MVDIYARLPEMAAGFLHWGIGVLRMSAHDRLFMFCLVVLGVWVVACFVVTIISSLSGED